MDLECFGGFILIFSYLFGIFSERTLSIRYKSVLELINSASFRQTKLSIRYQFGEMVIFPVTEFIFPVLFSIIPVENSDNTGLIVIFPGNKNDFSGTVLCFSGLISSKLSRLCRYFPKLLIASLSFRLSIRGFCRNFVDIYREFSETAGMIQKLWPDRSESISIIYRLHLMPNPSILDIFGHCPILSTDKYPIKSKDVQIYPIKSKGIQRCSKLSRNVKL